MVAPLVASWKAVLNPMPFGELQEERVSGCGLWELEGVLLGAGHKSDFTLEVGNLGNVELYD